jgi:hypothetical protein
MRRVAETSSWPQISSTWIGVNVYEEWETDSKLDAFRGAGPGQELAVDIVHADVSRYRISASGPA